MSDILDIGLATDAVLRSIFGWLHKARGEQEALIMWMDNESSILMMENFDCTKRTRTYEVRHLRSKELIETGVVKPKHVRTDDNPADVLTKPLGPTAFRRHAAVLEWSPNDTGSNTEGHPAVSLGGV